MSLTSLYFDMKNKKVLIIGAGTVGIRRAKRFINAEAEVYIISKSIDSKIKKDFLKKGVIFCENSKMNELIKKCDLIVIATNDQELNKNIALKAKGKLINCADNTELSNIIVPSTFNINNVTLSIYTNSKSPLMAKTLRKKIQQIITPEDILNVELQEYIRDLLKHNIKKQEERKKIMISILVNTNIQNLIKSGKIEEAKEYAKQYIKNNSP